MQLRLIQESVFLDECEIRISDAASNFNFPTENLNSHSSPKLGASLATDKWMAKCDSELKQRTIEISWLPLNGT